MQEDSLQAGAAPKALLFYVVHKAAMPYKSRWTINVPHISIPSFIFGSSTSQAVPESKLYINSKAPETHYLTLYSFREWSKCFAAGLCSAGLQRGDIVMLFSVNSLFTPVVLMSIVMA